MNIFGWFGALARRVKSMLGIGEHQVETPKPAFRLPGRRLYAYGSHERRRAHLKAKRRGKTPKRGSGPRPHRRSYLAGSGTFGGKTEISLCVAVQKRIRAALKGKSNAA